MLPDKRTRLLLIAASMVLWIASIFLPAAQFHENPGTASAQTITKNGFDMLFAATLFGWWMKANFAVFANPLAVFGLIFIWQQRYRRAIFWLAPAALLTLQTFQLWHTTWLEDEGGANMSYIAHLNIGWYVWVLSIMLPLIVAIHWHSLQKALPPTAPVHPEAASA